MSNLRSCVEMRSSGHTHTHTQTHNTHVPTCIAGSNIRRDICRGRVLEKVVHELVARLCVKKENKRHVKINCADI